MQHILSEAFPAMEQRYRANLLNCISGFKSLHLVGTINLNKQTNLAPFSQVMHIGADPALIGLLVRPHTVSRHTLENILETSVFTLNNVREDFLLQSHHTSARWDESEFKECRLTPWYSTRLTAPYVAEANVRIGLKLVETHTLKTNKTVLVVGAVQEIMFPRNCLMADGYLDMEKAGSLTSLGLDSYHHTQALARLSYAKPDRLPSLLQLDLVE